MTVGWLLFMVFCGAGLVALPLDMIREFLGRPRACITKSEYMTRAKALGNKAKGIMVLPPFMSLLLSPVLRCQCQFQCKCNTSFASQYMPWEVMLLSTRDAERCHAASASSLLANQVSNCRNTETSPPQAAPGACSFRWLQQLSP